MADLLPRLLAATWFRYVYCTTVGCDPDWTTALLCALERPRCLNCRRLIP